MSDTHDPDMADPAILQDARRDLADALRGNGRIALAQWARRYGEAALDAIAPPEVEDLKVEIEELERDIAAKDRELGELGRKVEDKDLKIARLEESIEALEIELAGEKPRA